MLSDAATPDAAFRCCRCALRVAAVYYFLRCRQAHAFAAADISLAAILLPPRYAPLLIAAIFADFSHYAAVDYAAFSIRRRRFDAILLRLRFDAFSRLRASHAFRRLFCLRHVAPCSRFTLPLYCHFHAADAAFAERVA